MKGTGSPIQAHLKTSVAGYQTQLSIYTESLTCADNVERMQFFDPNSAEWYVVSSAAMWDTKENATYYIMVHGAENEAPGWYESGNFELTLQAHQRPANDQCPSASTLKVGAMETGTTSFATIDTGVTVCGSQVSSGNAPTAPGVWYRVTGEEGALAVSIASPYVSQLTIFTGDSCNATDFVCIEGTNIPHTDMTDLDEVLSASIKWNADKGKTYFILVHAADTMAGPFELSLSRVDSPSVPEASTTNETLLEGDDTSGQVQTTASLSFGFFPGVFLKMPSSQEVSALMSQTEKFFASVFSDAYDNAFVRFEASTYIASMSNETAFPVVISFQASLFFAPGASLPSPDDAFDLMKEADFQNYIRSYAWKSEPFGINMFFQTLRATFGKAKVDPTDSAAVEINDAVGESVQRIDAKAKMYFSFFPDSRMHSPSEEEINGLLEQTQSFFNKVLQTKFDDFVRLGARAETAMYAERDLTPIVVFFEFHAFFALPEDGATKELRTQKQLQSAIMDVKLGDYIQNYVWESKPFSENIFYEAMHVIIESDDESLSVFPATVTPSVEGEVSQEWLDVVLYFNFHNTSSVPLRKPEAEEVDGLMSKTMDYFTEYLKDELPGTAGFSSLSMVATRVDYNETAAFPVAVYVVVEMDFHVASQTNPPSEEELLALMEAADMTNYVEYYVWFAEPVGSAFFVADQAVLESHTREETTVVATHTTLAPDAETQSPESSTQADSSTTNSSSTEMVDLLSVETDVAVIFNFFREDDNNNNRAATDAEVAALSSQTHLFFTKVLSKVYDDLIQLNLELTTVEFAEKSNEPSIVSWKVTAVFYVLDGSEATRTPENLHHILTSSDVEDYMHHYVWSSAPMGANRFFDTSSLQFEVDGNGEMSTPAATPAPAPTNELVLRANILYGFLPDQVIDSKPTSVEEEGIIYQTSLFFNKLFRQEFSKSFKKATTTIREVTLVEGDALPIVISYEMLVIFNDVDSVPSTGDLYQVLESADFQNYIEFYVWNAEPKNGGMFFDTQQVIFQTLV